MGELERSVAQTIARARRLPTEWAIRALHRRYGMPSPSKLYQAEAPLPFADLTPELEADAVLPSDPWLVAGMMRAKHERDYAEWMESVTPWWAGRPASSDRQELRERGIAATSRADGFLAGVAWAREHSGDPPVGASDESSVVWDKPVDMSGADVLRGSGDGQGEPRRVPANRVRHTVHYDVIPHSSCPLPSRCDCECAGCLRDPERTPGVWTGEPGGMVP